MKKQYIAPELDTVLFDINDIITHSLATGHPSGSDNDTDVGDDYSGISADGRRFHIGGLG
ncbi:MAG: hypothetical protein E7595_07515 [Ruminococcaceae bacterium]|nr:hypothetical protein [Oscillospiraceae bacterium]